ncbi:MAG: hypothetical protein V4563_17715 [Pseudomonadota bacterium]
MTYKEFEAAKEHYRWRLFASVLSSLQQGYFRYYDNGGRISDIARTLERSEKWVDDRLTGRKELTLNNISDLALAMGFEIRWQLIPIAAAAKEIA